MLTGKDGGKKPLIIFIDELDRCRPTYALELLEKAKHFFDIKGIIFVLAIDKEQIGHSIRSVYGVGMDVDGYLRRFIDLDYHLPEPDTEKFCEALFNRFGFEEYFGQRAQHGSPSDKGDMLSVLAGLFAVFGFSLRKQEQCFSRLSIVFRTTPPNIRLYPLFLGALIALKAAKTELYTGYINGEVRPDEVLRFIQQAAGGKKVLKYDFDDELEAYFFYGPYNGQIKNNDADQYLEQYKKTMEDESLSQEKRDRAREKVENFQRFRRFVGYGMLPQLSKRIEMAESFS